MAKWERVSVELSHTWPGEAYLRFQAADGTAMMVAVDKDDLHRISDLKNALGATIVRESPAPRTLAAGNT